MRLYRFPAALAAMTFALVLLGVAPQAQAVFLTPTTWTRGDPYSTYQQWQVFSSAAGPNAPDVGEFPNATTFPHPPRANVADTSGAAFVTSGGNIYSFSGPTDIDVTTPNHALGSSYVTTVILQTKTLGTEADYTSVRLTYNDGTDHTILPSQPRSELLRIALGGMGGFDVESAYEFQVPYNATSLKLEFAASSSSMSLDAVAVDTFTTRLSSESPLLSGMSPTIGFVTTPVPEPGAIGVLLLAAPLFFRRRVI